MMKEREFDFSRQIQILNVLLTTKMYHPSNNYYQRPLGSWAYISIMASEKRAIAFMSLLSYVIT
jgi:hypothetical protein